MAAQMFQMQHRPQVSIDEGIYSLGRLLADQQQTMGRNALLVSQLHSATLENQLNQMQVDHAAAMNPQLERRATAQADEATYDAGTARAKATMANMDVMDYPNVLDRERRKGEADIRYKDAQTDGEFAEVDRKKAATALLKEQGFTEAYKRTAYWPAMAKAAEERVGQIAESTRVAKARAGILEQQLTEMTGKNVFEKHARFLTSMARTPGALDYWVKANPNDEMARTLLKAKPEKLDLVQQYANGELEDSPETLDMLGTIAATKVVPKGDFGMQDPQMIESVKPHMMRFIQGLRQRTQAAKQQEGTAGAGAPPAPNKGAEGAAGGAAATGSGGELPVVRTKEEAAKLPEGTRFRDPSGREWIAGKKKAATQPAASAE